MAIMFYVVHTKSLITMGGSYRLHNVWAGLCGLGCRGFKGELNQEPTPDSRLGELVGGRAFPVDNGPVAQRFGCGVSWTLNSIYLWLRLCRPIINHGVAGKISGNPFIQHPTTNRPQRSQTSVSYPGNYSEPVPNTQHPHTIFLCGVGQSVWKCVIVRPFGSRTNFAWCVG